MDQERTDVRNGGITLRLRAIVVLVAGLVTFLIGSSGTQAAPASFSMPRSVEFAVTSFGSATAAQIVFSNTGSTTSAAPVLTSLVTHGNLDAFFESHDLDGPDSCTARTQVDTGSYCAIWLRFEPPADKGRMYNGSACFTLPANGGSTATVCVRLQARSA